MERPGLTTLSDTEDSFRRAVRDFAEETLRSRTTRMDRDGVMDREVIDSCFSMGLMGIEVPEAYGGQGGTFFQAVLAVEELARVDPSVAVMVDVQTTLFENLMLRWANEEQKKSVL